MIVDTGQFAKITGDVARLGKRVNVLAARQDVAADTAVSRLNHLLTELENALREMRQLAGRAPRLEVIEGGRRGRRATARRGELVAVPPLAQDGR